MNDGEIPSEKDYVKIVEWSDEDQLYIGSAPPLIGQCCHGKDEVEVMKELRQIVAEWIEIFQKDGKPLPAPTVDRDYSKKVESEALVEQDRFGCIRTTTDRRENFRALMESLDYVRTGRRFERDEANER